ncbi:MAG: glycosyltransferase [Verrucomicrobiae bacterium]|nr:glycosyltransferase [Verrucomicrobiae bacterium]
MRRWKIVHTEASEGWGGQEIRVLAEAMWFREHGHTVFLVAPSHSQIFARARAERFEVFPIGFQKRDQIADVTQLARVFLQTRPDIVCTHSSVDSWVGLSAAMVARSPLRVRYRHVSTPIAKNPQNMLLYRYMTHLTITTSSRIAEEIKSRFQLPIDRVCNVPTGIQPPQSLLDRETARRNLALELNLPQHTRFIGQVSVLRSWKGHRLLMSAFDRLAENFPNLHLVLVGTGPGEPHLKRDREMLACKDRIHFLGHRDAPWNYFRAMDLCILASTSGEGVPQSILQAMAAGTPVIATRVGGIPEALNQGMYGELIPPHSVEALIAAIEKCLRHYDACIARAEKAELFVKTHHTIDQMGNKILQLFNYHLS